MKTMQYVSTLPAVDYKTIVSNNYSFSAAQYRGFRIKNKNRKKVREFLVRPLTRNDLGVEVGSLNYIEYSPCKFLRTKGLQPHSFIPDITSESLEFVRPNAFVNCHLTEGDIILSKDSNIGEVAMLERDYPDTMLSGAIYKLPVGADKYYLFAFLKHPLFKEQLDYLTPKGSVIRHCKTLFLDCEIPIPNVETDATMKYIETIVKAIVTKERLITERHNEILRLIEKEIDNNQAGREFSYEMPTYSEIRELGRLDSKPYCETFKKAIFKIKNYKGGYQTIEGLGFTMSRGQNLQVSSIGKSIYSDIYYPGFYTLMLPKSFSRFGTCEKIKYLGNPRALKTLKVGDLIFGAEGFEKGRSIVVVESSSKTITNIHGITIKQVTHGNLTDAVFVKCFLDYLRNYGLIDMLAVGGNGGSLAQKYWGLIPFPVFPERLKTRIAKLYHNADADYDAVHITDSNFEARNAAFDKIAGICELDKIVKHLKLLLNSAIEKIANDEMVVREY